MQTTERTLRRWTVDQFYQMAEMGWFQDQRVELIDGEIITMAPQRDIHAAVLSLTGRALEKTFDASYWVRQQLPLHLSDDNEPEPDVAIVKGSPRDYIGTGHPTGALLVVEISDTTLKFDCGEKASLYAAHGILDYWVVNLKARRLEVYRDIVADPSQRFGHRYQTRKMISAGRRAVPLALKSASVLVDDLLP